MLCKIYTNISMLYYKIHIVTIVIIYLFLLILEMKEGIERET